MRRFLLLLTCVLPLLVTVVPASAATVRYLASLSGAAEVSPVASPGTGWVTLDIIDGTTMSLSVSFAGLVGTTTLAHIHNAPAGANGPVMTPVPAFVDFPLGVTSGSYTRSFDLDLSTTYSGVFVNGDVASAKAAFLAALAGGNAYFNLHSTVYPGGELRGQLAPIPLPAGATLLLGAFAVLGIAARRRG